MSENERRKQVMMHEGRHGVSNYIDLDHCGVGIIDMVRGPSVVIVWEMYQRHENKSGVSNPHPRLL